MATLYKQGTGYSLQIGRGNGRRTKRLGKLNRDGVAAVRFHVGQIELSRKSATIVPATTATWLKDIDDDLHLALAELGLCEKRATASNFGILPTVGKLFEDYLSRRPDLKQFTHNSMNQAKNQATEYFGARAAVAITNGDAKDYVRWLKKEKYSQATIAGFVNKTRQVFNDAIDRQLLTVNPFRKVKGGSQVNEDRLHYVTRDEFEKLSAAAGSLEWRLLLAMARYGGVRVPSELIGLTAADCDFAKDRVLIRSTKTEHQGKPTRVIPMFTELRQLLAEAVASMKPDQVRLIPICRPGYNPHTHAERIFNRAGMTPWPKIFQNMRSTRETELLSEGFPLHVVCAWIGNSERIARKHYLQVTEQDFAKAVSNPTLILKSAAQSAAHDSDALAQLAQEPVRNQAFLPENIGNRAFVDFESCPRQGSNL